MSRQVSPSIGKIYGLQRVTRIWGVSRATIYRHRQEPVARTRPGPIGAMPDADLVRAIRQHNPHVLTVPGNWDDPDACAYLTREGINLHRRHVIVDQVAFAGVGGSLPSIVPTPNELTEAQLAEALADAIAHLDPHLLLILLCHQPPAQTLNDLTWSQMHVGSTAVRTFIEQRAFGQAGERIVVEECLVGQEASILAIVDGGTIIPLEASQDHKRAYDGDQGPNTGGMGAYSPAPVVTTSIAVDSGPTVTRSMRAPVPSSGL